MMFLTGKGSTAPAAPFSFRDLWRSLLGSERRLGQLRNLSVILLIVLLAQASARFTWALFTPVPQLAPAGVALVETRAASRANGSSPAEAAARAEKLAALHLFGRAEPQPTDAAATAALLEAPETTLSLTLKGLLATTSSERGWAVIAEKGRRGQDSVYVHGDTVPGNATIEAIFVDRVILRRAGQLETLYLEGRDEKQQVSAVEPRRPATTAAQRRTPAPAAPAGRQLSRSYVDQTLANLPDLAREVEIHIHNPAGGRQGFRLVAPQGASSFLENLGLQSGDILYEVNGIPLSDAGAAMVAFEQLRDAPNIHLVFERDGAQQQSTIAIR